MRAYRIRTLSGISSSTSLMWLMSGERLAVGLPWSPGVVPHHYIWPAEFAVPSPPARRGFMGYVAYVLLYAGLEVLALPAIPLTMTAGALFGVAPGTITVSVAATLGATISFLISRYLAR